MTDENLDSGQGPADGGQPSSQVAGNGDKRSSGSATPEQDVLGERLTRMEKMISSLQGDKDRSVKRVEGEVGELRKTFGELQSLIKGGLSEDEAFEKLEGKRADADFRDAVFEIRNALKNGSFSARAGGAKEQPSVIAQYGLDANDPEVIANVLSQTDQKDAEIAALKIAHRRSNQKPASPSEVGSISSKSAPTEDASSLKTNYINEMRAAQGNRKLLEQLRNDYAKKGVDVYNIDFTAP